MSGAKARSLLAAAAAEAGNGTALYRYLAHLAAVADATGGETDGNEVTGDGAYISGGSYGLASLTGEGVLANGQTEGLGDAVGNRQAAQIVVRGDTPGAGPNESIELFGGNPGAQPTAQSGALRLLPSKAYGVWVNKVAARVGVPGTGRAELLHAFVSVDAQGAVSVVSQAIVSSHGSTDANLYSTTLSGRNDPARLGIVFRTGSGNTHAVRVVAHIRWVEVLA